MSCVGHTSTMSVLKFIWVERLDVLETTYQPTHMLWQMSSAVGGIIQEFQTSNGVVQLQE